MSSKHYTRTRDIMNLIFNEEEMAMTLLLTVEELVRLTKQNKMPRSFPSREVYGHYIYYMDRYSFNCVTGLRVRGVKRIVDLFRDAEDNNFINKLKHNFNRFDLSSYS